MKRKPALAILSLIVVLALAINFASAQAPAQAAFPPCVPAAQAAAPAAGGRGAATPAQGQAAAAQQRIPRDAAVTAIAGVVNAGAKWTKIWQAAGNSADGIIADKDGNMLVAQEDYDTVLKIDSKDKPSVYVSGAKGVGSISMDRQWRLFGAHRTERPGSTKPDRASIVNAITIPAPEW